MPQISIIFSAWLHLSIKTAQQIDLRVCWHLYGPACRVTLASSQGRQEVNLVILVNTCP